MRAKIIASLLLYFVTGLHGQEIDEKTHSFGLSFSNGVSWPFGNIEETIKPGYGLAVTAFYEGKYKKWFGLEAGIEYSNVRYSMENPTRWFGEEDGIIGFDTEFFPPYDNNTGAWNPSFPAYITEWTQEKRTGFLSIYCNPRFYLPTKKVELYLFTGLSLDFAMHQYTDYSITEKYYGVFEDSFREVLITTEPAKETISIGLISGLGIEKNLNDKIKFKAEVYDKIFEVIKFHRGEYHDWYVNYSAVKVGIVYSIKR